MIKRNEEAHKQTKQICKYNVHPNVNKTTKYHSTEQLKISREPTMCYTSALGTRTEKDMAAGISIDLFPVRLYGPRSAPSANKIIHAGALAQGKH